MSGIAVAGNLILDQYKVVDAYPAASALTSIRSVSAAPGGLLCNCALDLARLDPQLRIPVVGVVGDDPHGDFLVDRLRREPGIDTSFLHRGDQTSFSDVMEDPVGKTRTFFQFRGANDLLDLEHLDFDKLDADLLHIGYLLLLDTLDQPDPEYGTRMARLLAAAQAHGIRTSVDAVSEQSDRFATLVPPALRYADYCILNELEAARTTGIGLAADARGRIAEAALREAAEALLAMGVSTWVVIHWPGGAAGLSATGQWVLHPSVLMDPAAIMTTTGAGDAFASGVLYAAWAGRDLAEAVEAGIGSAACSLLAANATDGVRSYPEVLAYYRDSAHHAL